MCAGGRGGGGVSKAEITNHIVGDVLLLLFFVSGICFVNNYDTDFIYMFTCVPVDVHSACPDAVSPTRTNGHVLI